MTVFLITCLLVLITVAWHPIPIRRTHRLLALPEDWALLGFVQGEVASPCWEKDTPA